MLASVSLVSCGGDSDGGGGGGFPQVSNTNFEAQEAFASEIPIRNHIQLTLIGQSGSVTITGMSGENSVKITALKRVQSESTADATAHLIDLKIDVRDLGNEVLIQSMQPQGTESGGRNYIVDYTITMPENLRVAVNNLNGTVTLKNIFESVAVNLLNGTIESDVNLPLNGTIDMNTLSGDIHLMIPVNTSAEFSAAVSIGSITVSNLILQNEVKTSTFWGGTLGSGQGKIALEAKQLGNIRVSGF